MELGPDEKELLASFERGEWRSVDAEEIARKRGFARYQLHQKAPAGIGEPATGERQSSDHAQEAPGSFRRMS